MGQKRFMTAYYKYEVTVYIWKHIGDKGGRKWALTVVIFFTESNFADQN